MRYKYSEIEKDIQELMKEDRVDKYYLYSLMIQEITKDDCTATRLANKVLERDIRNMIEKIQALFQRSHADCKSTEGMSDIELLISWLNHINPDYFN